MFLILLLVGFASAEASIIKGPYLQNVNQTAITVMWETNESSASRIDYGLTDSYGFSEVNSTNTTIHEIRLSNLTVDTLYHYKVTSDTTESLDNTFKTAAANTTPFRFVVYGDTRSNPSDHLSVVNAIIESNPEIVLHTGDIINDGRVYNQWGSEFFTPASNLIKNKTVFTSLGNHENNASWYYSFFSNPTESGNEAWYSFEYGNSHFIALDTTQDFSVGSNQYNWLVSDLNSSAATSSTWIFVFFHHPPYTSGAHGTPEATGVNVRNWLVPVFEFYGVDVVFNGHDHQYERSYKSGIYYLVAGGGGAPLRSVNQTENPYQQLALSTLHHCTIDVNGSSLTINALFNNGTVFDSFSMQASSTTSVGMLNGWNLISIPVVL